MEQNSTPLPLETTDPALAEHLRQVANGEHPVVRTVVVNDSAIQILDNVGKWHVTRRAKVGRNEPCPCGSGKKLKKCHGKPK